jgi:hypothetical protein
VTTLDSFALLKADYFHYLISFFEGLIGFTINSLYVILGMQSLLILGCVHRSVDLWFGAFCRLRGEKRTMVLLHGF